MSKYDLIIKGGKLVIPDSGVVEGDLGVNGEKIAAIAESIEAEEGAQVIEAKGKYVFPVQWIHIAILVSTGHSAKMPNQRQPLPRPAVSQPW